MVNDVTRQSYIDEVRFSTDPLGTTNGQLNTGLVYFYSPEDINVRSESLALIGRYAAGLDEISSSDAPKQAEAAIQSSASSVDSLAKGIASLAKSPANSANYAAPLTDLAGMITGAWVERKKEKMLIDSIKHNQPIVDGVLHQLQVDLTEVKKTYKRSVDRSVTVRTVYYSKSLASSGDPMDDKRKQILAEAQNFGSISSRLADADPVPLIETLSKLNAEIAKCVTTEACSKITRHEKLFAELELFSDQAARFTTSMDQLEAAYKPTK